VRSNEGEEVFLPLAECRGFPRRNGNWKKARRRLRGFDGSGILLTRRIWLFVWFLGWRGRMDGEYPSCCVTKLLWEKRCRRQRKRFNCTTLCPTMIYLRSTLLSNVLTLFSLGSMIYLVTCKAAYVLFVSDVAIRE
jgi:hypothetical protein